MEIDYAFLTRAADLSPDGTLSMLGVGFETIRSRGFPVNIQFALVVRLSGVVPGREEILAELDIVGPDGKTILDAPISSPLNAIKVPTPKSVAPSGTANLIIQLAGVMLQSPGVYHANLRLTGEKVVEKKFRIVAETANAS